MPGAGEEFGWNVQLATYIADISISRTYSSGEFRRKPERLLPLYEFYSSHGTGLDNLDQIGSIGGRDDRAFLAHADWACPVAGPAEGHGYRC